MKIQALTRHPRRDRVRIRFEGDDVPPAELALELVVREALAAGQHLSPDRLAVLVREDENYRARDSALLLLAHRARSRVELRRRLERKGLDGVVIDRTMEYLDGLGYLDDQAFAEAFVRDRLRLRPRGRVGLVRELRERGVDPDVAEEAVARVLTAQGVDEMELALAAARDWARKNRSAVQRALRSRDDRVRARRRLYGHLARRGFAPDAVRAAIDRVLDD